MRKLIRNIQSIITILEVVGTLLSAIIFIFNKIGGIEKVNKNQSSTAKTDERNKV